MGNGASAYPSVAAAKADGKSQEEVNAFLSSSLSTKLEGKNVLVTGVAGIGGAFASICAAQGAKVFLVDRDESAFSGIEFGGDNLVKIQCDVGLKDGADVIAAAVGEDPIHFALLCASCSAQVDDMGHRFTTIGYDHLDDMIRTDAHGKLFVVQKLLPNLQAAASAAEESKARVFSIGSPAGEGPMPNGKYMVLPGWAGFGVAKAAAKWVHEGMKAELSDKATFGYGHPGVTKTPFIERVSSALNPEHPLSMMTKKRWETNDYHTPVEAAKMFYAVMTATDDEEFTGTTWNVVKMHERFGREQGAKETSDVKNGLQKAGQDLVKE